MKAMRRMLLPAVLVLMPCLLSAQNFRGGYFLDGYLLGYKSNPAFANDTDFISLFLGQSVTSVKSDLSLKNLLYPGPGGESLVTEMTPQLAPLTRLNHNLALGLAVPLNPRRLRAYRER